MVLIVAVATASCARSREVKNRGTAIAAKAVSILTQSNSSMTEIPSCRFELHRTCITVSPRP
jgi:hypothetical protein